MDPSTLAATAVTFFSSYPAKIGEKSAEKIGEKLPEAASKVWNAITTRFKGKPTAEVAIQGVVAQPDDADNRAAFRKELQKLLEAEPAFAAELDRLLSNAQSQGSDTITNTGSGAVATRGGVAPYGEPQWVTIPTGEFWMGSGREDGLAFDAEKPAHRLFLPEFQIARTPITNAQYQLYVQATGASAPSYWEGGQPPGDKLEHPVVEVSWHDALRYCRWLGQVTGKQVALPSEAQWEKAARGDGDRRVYPWGDDFSEARCNSDELALQDTTPVGIFLAGASPYGCLDMAGNVWEWTRSLWGKDFSNPEFKYPYNPEDRRREDSEAPDEVRRVLRGGAFCNDRRLMRCACRGRGRPGYHGWNFGFRVVVLP
jgi:formylglycine-generating enzyme required for sulfatase activity